MPDPALCHAQPYQMRVDPFRGADIAAAPAHGGIPPVHRPRGIKHSATPIDSEAFILSIPPGPLVSFDNVRPNGSLGQASRTAS